MQSQAYEGYFENGDFHTAGRTIRIPERRRVYIKVYDEPVQEKADNDAARQALWEDIRGLYGIVRSDIDEKAELLEARDEKNARFN